MSTFDATVLALSSYVVTDVCNGERECPACDKFIDRAHVCECGEPTGLVLASIEDVSPTRVAVTLLVDVEVVRSGALPFGEVRLQVGAEGKTGC